MKTANLSILRIIAIYWVVLWQHNFAPFSKAWGWVCGGVYSNTFGNVPLICNAMTHLTMPACFFVSGAVFSLTKSSGRKPLDFFEKKTMRILIPCLLFGCLFQIIMEHQITLRDQMGGYKHMWFLWNLFCFMITTYAVMHRTKIYGLFFLYAAYTICVKCLWYQIPEILKWYDYYHYFLLGVGIYYFSVKRQIIRYSLIIIMGIGIITVELLGKNLDTWLFLWEIIVILELLKFIPSKIISSKTFAFVDRTSFGVYIFHMIWLYIFYQLCLYAIPAFLISNRMWMTTVMAMLTIPLSLLSTIFIQKTKFLRI